MAHDPMLGTVAAEDPRAILRAQLSEMEGRMGSLISHLGRIETKPVRQYPLNTELTKSSTATPEQSCNDTPMSGEDSGIDSGAGVKETEPPDSSDLSTTISLRCANCKITFASEREKEDHFAAVHPNRGHHCPICGFAFKQRAHLKTHIEVRHDKKRFPCTECDMSFTTLGTLRRHIAVVHEKKRDCECPQCKMTFTQRSDMRRHVLTVHEKQKPHQCDICGSAFSQAWDRRRHKKACHSEKPTREKT